MEARTREACERRDREDPLRAARDRFALPGGVIYLDGNSLGARPAAASSHVARVVEREWGDGLIASWNDAGWIDMPLRVGDKLAPLIGAGPGQVAVGDSTSVNIFKALAAALALNPARREIVIEDGDFPTDAYIARGIATFQRDVSVRSVPAAAIAEAAGVHTAVVLVSHTNYRTGLIHDLAATTAAIQDRGALVCWDLSHSAGAMPVGLDAAGADLAVGCTYKFLNGGPGAPAYIYVAHRHQRDAHQPLTGWLGHADPFAFAPDYVPAVGIGRFVCGTPSVLSLAAVECGIDAFEGFDFADVRAKSTALTQLAIDLVDARCGTQALEVITPRDPAVRGSHVSLRHPQAFAVGQALKARGVVGDFRPPDVLRLGIAPLYIRHVDVWDAVDALVAVLDGREWDDPRHHVRGRVT